MLRCEGTAREEDVELQHADEGAKHAHGTEAHGILARPWLVGRLLQLSEKVEEVGPKHDGRRQRLLGGSRTWKHLEVDLLSFDHHTRRHASVELGFQLKPTRICSAQQLAAALGEDVERNLSQLFVLARGLGLVWQLNLNSS